MTSTHWVDLHKHETLNKLIEASYHQPVLVYKHSTRCSLSSVIRSRLEHKWSVDPLNITCYYLDLFSYRDISNAVAETFQVNHQSPQVLLIAGGKCMYHWSHLGISHQSIKNALDQMSAPKSN